ncbi:hypothetical protein VTO42DRAFT_6620 [Malbranchea cinnamomea]
MPPSQLKQLKASLRERGIVGPPQSKKQKRKAAKSGDAAADRARRNAILQELREQFNPFEIRAPARPAKFDVTTRVTKEPVKHRPGVTRGLGEERRKETLLKEIQRKNKVGVIVDRRFGENDPTMTPEEKAAERFARESQKRFRKESIFNLEDDEEEVQLTHMGQSLFTAEERDDFNDDDIEGSDDDSDAGRKAKRKRIVEVDDMEGLASESEQEDEQPRKKSKKEVMEEIIAKSKAYKYARQKAREDDNDLRVTLDKDLPNIFDVMRGVKPPEPEPAPASSTAPATTALPNGTDKDKEYDQRLRLLNFDKRARPADRTKTEEEKAEEEAERLRKLEEERLKRMRGEEDEESQQKEGPDDFVESDSEPDDAKQFGLSQPAERKELGVEDEDDFIIDEDLVEMGSVSDLSLSEDEGSESPGEEEEEVDEDDDEEFTSGLTLPMNADSGSHDIRQLTGSDKNGLAYTYPCPETHEQFLEIVRGIKFDHLPTVVQRIRALHHPRLHPDNKAKLGVFAGILVNHVAHLANQPTRPPFSILENLLRHVHSLAKSHPEPVASAFRNHLREMGQKRPLNLLPGDLVLLTGVATIFPTSDHFHPVVTPAILSMGRYLGQGTLESLGDVATGAYIGSLCLQYQVLSKRYIPEFINYVLNALCILAPSEPKSNIGYFPSRKPSTPLNFLSTGESLAESDIKKPSFWDILTTSEMDGKKNNTLKLSLISTFVSLLDASADLWVGKSAFFEIFSPAKQVLRHLGKTCANKVPTSLSDQIQHTIDKFQKLLSQAKRTRRPLLLHNHRPLAIKMAIPKFEESFNPDRHYDPDRQRAELNRLKAEYKRERKGAMRELRKDANFIARENLREKRERDAEYERKYRRLIAEIQSEEGREAKAYEREKKARKGKL